MKAKALRFKDTKEYVHIENFGDEPMVCTGELPNLHPMTATIDLMKQLSEAEDMEDLFDFDNMEFVEVEVIEVGEVGADIRNKLSPYKNLVALVEILLEETHPDKKKGLKKLIRQEIVQSKKSVEYIAKLL